MGISQYIKDIGHGKDGARARLDKVHTGPAPTVVLPCSDPTLQHEVAP